MDIINHYKPKDQIDEFVLAKHYIGLQMAINVFLGQRGGTINDECTIDQLEFKDDKIMLSCFLIVDLDTTKLSPCREVDGNGSCGVTCNCVIGDYIKNNKK